MIRQTFAEVTAQARASNKYEDLENFEPEDGDDFEPTEAPAGSAQKIEVLRQRVERGQPLWHRLDRIDYSGLKGCIRPRNS